MPPRRAAHAPRALSSKPAQDAPSPARGGERAETQRVSDSELRAIFGAMTENIFVLDAEGRFLKIVPTNPAFLYRSPDKMLGKRLDDIFSPARASIARGYIQRALETRQTLSLEYSLRIDGRLTWFSATVSPLMADTVIWVARDITERKRIEESEREQRLLAEALRDSAAALNGTLNFDEVLDRILVNVERVVPHDAAGVMLIEAGAASNVRTRGFAERGLEAFVHSFNLPVFDTPDLNAMIVTGKPIVIQETRDFPGWVAFPETSWIRSSVKAPIRIKDEIIGFLNLDSSTPGFFTSLHAERLQIFADQVAVALENARLFASVQQELAERQRAQAALRESEERFRSIVERTQAFLVNVDTQGRFTYVNDAAAKILGYPNPQGLIGKQYLSFVHPEDRKRVRRAYLTQVATRQESVAQEFRGLDAAGKVRWLSFVSNPLIEDGRVVGQTGVAQDITERKRAEEQVERRAREFAALYETTRDLATQQDLPTLLQSIAERAADLLAAPAGAIYLYDALQGDLHVALTTNSIVPVGTRINLGEGMAGRVAQTRQRLIVNDYKTWPLRSPKYEGVPFGAVIEVPMLSGGELIGVLVVQEAGGKTREFTDADARLLSLFASQAASAVHNARLLGETQQRAREMKRLYELGRQLNSALDLAVVLQMVADAARELSGAKESRVFAPRAEGGQWLRSISTLQPEHFSPVRPTSPRPGGKTETILRTGQPIVIQDIADDPDVDTTVRARGIRSLVGMPIPAGSRTIGVLFADSEEPNAFDAHAQELLAILATQAGIAIQNARLFEETQQRAQRQDALYRVSTSLATMQGERELCETVVRACRDVLGYPYSGIFLVEPETGDRVLYAQSGWEAAPKDWRLHPGEGLSEKPTLTGELQYTPDVTREPRYVQGMSDSRSEVDVPIKIGEMVLGVLVIERAHVDAFDAGDFGVLQAVANQLAVALQNTRLFDAAQHELAERKQAEKTLTEERTLLRTIMDNIPDPIFVKDTESRFVIDNVAHRNFIGVKTADQVLGKTSFDFRPQEVAARLIAVDRAVMESGKPVINKEDLITNPGTGKQIWRVQSKVPLRDSNGKVIGLVGIAQDITERKQAEKALQTAAEVARVVTAVLDIDQVLPRVVDLLCERFGYYHAGVLLVDAAGEWAILRASSSQTSQHELENVLKFRVGEQGMVGFTTRTGQPRIAQDVTTDPTYFAHPALPDTRSEAVFPLRIGDQVVGALDVQSTEPNVFTENTVAILTMIADQIAVAIQNARLHQIEKERARELDQAYRTLQANQEKLLVVEKMASLGRLTAGIAHEMNTPLAAVRAALAELGQLGVEYQNSIGDADVSADDHRAIAQEMLHSIQLADNAAARAAGFVRGIKAQTRDLASTERRRFNAVTVIEEALLLLRHALREKNCTATFEPVAENMEMFGSPGRLTQIVTNLITNAIDASADCGGGPIAIHLAPYDHGIELQVSDRGCGIPPENLSKIFDPMFTTKPFGEGTGLGLAIVHDIVTGEFGGTIQVTSQVGQGTTFSVRFPQRKEA